jgi:transcriptional regulator with XRE-family HTH domain
MKSEEYRQRLADKLSQVMRDNGWSASELSRRSGINTTSMNSYVAAMSFPTKESREKIAHGIFEISLEELDAEIENRPVQRQSNAEDVCREIRLMDDNEFLAIHSEVSKQVVMRFRRLQNQPPEI